MCNAEIHRSRPLSEYGRIGNRPMSEIQRKASRNPLSKEMGKTILRGQVYPSGYLHNHNDANRFLGYIDRERSAWLACIDAVLALEIEFAFWCEKKIHDRFIRTTAMIERGEL